MYCIMLLYFAPRTVCYVQPISVGINVMIHVGLCFNSKCVMVLAIIAVPVLMMIITLNTCINKPSILVLHTFASTSEMLFYTKKGYRAPIVCCLRETINSNTGTLRIPLGGRQTPFRKLLSTVNSVTLKPSSLVAFEMALRIASLEYITIKLYHGY